MMKPILIFFTFFSFLTLLTSLPSCKKAKKPDAGLIFLDVPAGLKNKKEFRLSEMVDYIEYVKLETKPECLISNASRVIGNTCILLLNNEPQQVLLFDRSGKFIRLIGKIGKGTGEYSFPVRIDLSPNEDRIIVYDMMQRRLIEYSLDGIVLSDSNVHDGVIGGPYNLDQEHIAYMQQPLADSLHYPRVITMNLRTGEQKPVWFNNFKTNQNEPNGVYLSNNFLLTDDGIVFKDALCDTIFLLASDFTIKPAFNLKTFPNPPAFYKLSEQELDAASWASLSSYTNDFLFLIGTDKERFHLVYNSFTKETFSLPKIRECGGEGDYSYGIINDLDGTATFWFWSGNIRNKQTSNLFQVIDLKELIKTDCFLKADLRTNEYRDQLTILADASSENDNPVIRIMHVKQAR